MSWGSGSFGSKAWGGGVGAPANVTVALTGFSAATSLGTLTAHNSNYDVTVALTGVSTSIITKLRNLQSYATGENPEYICSGPDGNLWFTDYYNDRIGRSTPEGTITFFSTPTTGAGCYSICAGPDGNVWFTESLAGKIGRITPDGVITEFSPAFTSEPYGICLGPDNNLWFTEPNINGLGTMTTDGVLTEFNPGLVTDICIIAGPDGALWFSSQTIPSYNGCIGRITTSGTVTHFTGFYDFPSALAVGADGNIWFGEGSNYVGKITPSGTITEYAIPASGYYDPHGICLGPDGNIWISLYYTNEMLRVTTAGVVTTALTPYYGLRGLCSDSSGKVWGVDKFTGIFSFDPYIDTEGCAAGSFGAYAYRPIIMGVTDNYDETPYLGSTSTFSHDATGADMLVLAISAQGFDDGVVVFSGITYGGVALTQLNTVSTSIDTEYSGASSEIWYLNSPSSGTNDIVISYDIGDYLYVSALNIVGGMLNTGSTNLYLYGNTTTQKEISISSTLLDLCIGVYTAPYQVLSDAAEQFAIEELIYPPNYLDHIVSGKYSSDVTTTLKWLMDPFIGYNGYPGAIAAISISPLLASGLMGLTATAGLGSFGIETSVALTGVGAGSAVGSFGTASQLAITGNDVYIGLGDLSFETTVGISGNQTAAGIGTLSVGERQVAITGNAAGMALGTLLGVISSPNTVALTGFGAKASLGLLRPAGIQIAEGGFQRGSGHKSRADQVIV